MEEEKTPYDKITYAKEFFRSFHRDADYLNDIYRAEGNSLRYAGSTTSTIDRKQYFSILWANVQILLPSIYQKAPSAYVERRFHDKDDIGRAASEILERVLDFVISDSSFEDTVRDAVKNRLIVGQGTIWVRHAPDIYEDGEIIDKIEIDNVGWEDFLCSPSDRWSNVSWVARRVYLSSYAFKKQFNKSPTLYGMGGITGDQLGYASQEERKIYNDMYPVWEYWDKETKTISFIMDGSGETIQEIDDFLRLEGFFPCPKPFYSTTTPNTIIPVPDYKEYITQAEEINELTRRIGLLTSAIRSVGFYDAAQPEIERLFTEARETQLIPVTNYKEFLTGGGISESIQWVPNAENASVLQTLIQAREQAIISMSEISGITQESRGSTDAAETATAQNIKSENASIRLKAKQDDCFSFVGNCVKIIGEIIVKHFSSKSLLSMSNYEFETDYTPELFQQAYEFMQNYHNVKFRIKIEADSIMVANEMREQASRTEFLNMTMNFLAQGAQMAQTIPDIVPLMSKLLMFGVRAFRVGRELEMSIETELNTIEEKMREAQQQAQQQQGQDQQAGEQTIINEDAPKPLQPQDLLKANTETQKQMFDTLREYMSKRKEVIMELMAMYPSIPAEQLEQRAIDSGALMSTQELNDSMNAIIQTNKESDLQDLQMLPNINEQQKQSNENQQQSQQQINQQQ